MVLAHRPGSPWETDGFLKTREIPGVLFAKERFTERVGVGLRERAGIPALLRQDQSHS